ncbi:MAG: DUF3050 domain-containing protein [Thiogranum sp.]|nr:DUF3050 domain-containing protein [Thiogranum sp.]
MNHQVSGNSIQSYREALDNHPIYAAVRSIEDLQRFMEHHVYSVWDFMSLIKYLQAQVAPASVPWTPGGDTTIRRFINELVLEEESDLVPIGTDGGEVAISHFELYCKAMQEIGADPAAALAFVERVRQQGIHPALHDACIPQASREFMQSTFGFLDSNKPHIVAAALALGREHIIPGMFRALLERIGIDEQQAPGFHFYLNRHVHLDADFHAPLSLKLVNGLCGDSEARVREAESAARQAVKARLRFWDAVLEDLKQRAA